MPVPPTMTPRRSLLRDDVHDRLRDAVVAGTLAPGERLRDQELAAWLGVSRTPVREALLRLADAGLVVARPGRSTVVSDLDPQAVRNARDVVAAMHQLAVRTAVAGITADDLAVMRDAHHRFAVAVTAGDVDAATAADDDLHAVPVRVAGNAALRAVLAQHEPVLRRAERLRFSSAAAHASISRHTALLRRVEQGDAAGAAETAFDTWHSLDPADPEDAP